MADKLIHNLESFYKTKRVHFSSVEHLYFYQISGNNPELKILLDSKNANKTALNPLSKLKMDNNKNATEIQGLSFAETGNSFRGIDV